ncbi:response regulator, partial [Salmonella enterica subsp. enterica serovar Typhimurium]
QPLLPPNSSAAASPLSGKRVLVVDDNASAREILHATLAQFGIQTDVVDSGPACLQRLQQANAAGTPYHLVLLDWLMPGMDGIE